MERKSMVAWFRREAGKLDKKIEANKNIPNYPAENMRNLVFKREAFAAAAKALSPASLLEQARLEYENE